MSVACQEKAKAGERLQRNQVEVPLEPFNPDALRPVRYIGTMGDTEIEVRNSQNARMEVDEETGEKVIRSGDTVVLVKSKDKH